MADPTNRKNHEDIQRDLIRTAIKQPLLTMIRDPNNGDRQIPVIIESNDDYYAGKEKSVEEMRSLVKAVAGVELPSIGSEQNPYYKTSLTPRQILDIVDRDDTNAFRTHREAMEEKQRAATARQAAAAPPEQLARYLAIRRVWYNHPISPLMDRSISTVKADAAHRAFLAEGRDIVWAVIDSGIDGTHDHFAARETLNVLLPVQHCDFTAPAGIPGDDRGRASALVDRFGHGSHVAGIIAGAYFSDQRPAKAQRTKLGEGSQVEIFEEEISKIAGMAPSCKLVSLKVLNDNGDGDVSNIIAAIDRIQTINDFGRSIKIHGVNLSVGYEFDPLWFACGQSPVCVEVNRLVRTGVVVVVAAGNTGYGVLSANQRATGAGFMLTINDPGNAEFAITVGSTHRDAPHTYGVSYFSSKGPTGDGRQKPDLVAPGERILSCCSSMKNGVNATNVYVEDSGTSMAAPHVSGVIAAFLSIRREYIGNPEKVKELFLSTATDLGRNCYFQGRGLVDLMRAIQSI
ncbi:MAG TPA: S8 family peptidase [Candidatus Acidoferrales bacterium]|jgi:serine protease AprX|nr:S8 family peptidase [Candidatus Acidoferrales bacterium]